MKISRLEKELRKVGAGQSEAEKLADLAAVFDSVKSRGLSRETKRRLAPTPTAARPRLSFGWAMSLATVCLLVAVGAVFVPKFLDNKSAEPKPFSNTNQDHEVADASKATVDQPLPDKIAPAELAPLPETSLSAPAQQPLTQEESTSNASPSGFRENFYRQFYSPLDLYRGLPRLNKDILR